MMMVITTTMDDWMDGREGKKPADRPLNLEPCRRVAAQRKPNAVGPCAKLVTLILEPRLHSLSDDSESIIMITT